MRKAVNQWCFPREMPVRDCAQPAKSSGFTGLELCLEETGELSLETTTEDARRLARHLAAIGIPVPSIATRLYWKYTPTSGDPAIRRRVLEIARRQVDIAGLFGAGTILYVAGSVSDGETPIPYLRAYQRAKEVLADVARLAAAAGLRVGVENVWNNFLMSPLEMRTFLDETASPGVGAYLDTGNAFVYARPEDWIVTLGHRLIMVHFKDCRADIRSTRAFSPLLHGDVDWPAVMAALAEVGYAGDVVAEFVTPYRYCGDQLVRDLSAAMDRVLSLRPRRAA